MKGLRATFESGPCYGADLDCKIHTGSDAWTVLLQYLALLPEPVIPFSFYARFTAPLRGHGANVFKNTKHRKDPTRFKCREAIQAYQGLIAGLPLHHRHLFLYLISGVMLLYDLETSTTLQMAVLCHPQNTRDTTELALSRDVIRFFVHQQRDFLLQDTMRRLQIGG